MGGDEGEDGDFGGFVFNVFGGGGYEEWAKVGGEWWMYQEFEAKFVVKGEWDAGN